MTSNEGITIKKQVFIEMLISLLKNKKKIH